MKNWVLGLAIFFMALAGCATEPSYEEAFSASEVIKGSTETLPTSLETTWGSAIEVLSQQGFIVQQADTKNRIITANREMRDKKDQTLSYIVQTAVTFVPVSDQVTRVGVAANQTTEVHRKEYQWWHLLWIIPLFPIGSDYTTVVVNRDTIKTPHFYESFFLALNKSCCEEKGSLRSDIAPPQVGAGKKTGPIPATDQPVPLREEKTSPPDNLDQPATAPEQK